MTNAPQVVESDLRDRPDLEDQFQLTRSQLVAAIEGELRDYFFDGVSLMLEQYEIDSIIGGIVLRVRQTMNAVNEAN